MKKYLKLLIALSLVFVAGVNAKTFDFEGDNIEFGLYSSGDVLRNFDTYSMRVYFKVPNSTLSYIYVFESEDFSTMITGKNVFNVEENVEMPVTVPTVYGRNAIWNYESEEYDDIDEEWYDMDIFKALVLEPNYSIKCDKDYVEYGDSANCSLYMEYLSTVNEPGITMFGFNINSDDYNITNINTVNYFDNISNIYRFNLQRYRKNNGHGVPKIEEVFDEYSLYNVELDDEANITNRTKISYDDIPEDVYHSEQIKVLEFTISPKKDNADTNNINILKTMFRDIDSSESLNSTQTISIASPKKEEVKGVEEVTENPKTGLFNYLILIVPILLSLLGYKLVLNKNIFKFNK